jgi:hypothetical protein
MATLRKIELEDGKDSMISEGHTTCLPYVELFKYTNPEERKQIESVEEVEEGWQVLMLSIREFHNTSMIKEIIKVEGDTVTFRTQTSVYELTIPRQDIL